MGATTRASTPVFGLNTCIHSFGLASTIQRRLISLLIYREVLFRYIAQKFSVQQ